MVQAVGIFSGGLDSLLAAKLIMEQGYKPILITFVSPFFTAEKALESAKNLKITPKIIDITPRLLPLIKKPKHSLGKNLNPCIDCHALMFEMAGEYLKTLGAAGFLFSGEVLGQRPLSQNKNALSTVCKSSGQNEKIVRPLSAKLLEPSEAELKGYLNRDKLLDISGRGRKIQLELAKKYNFRNFPAPAGGCLLTDKLFAQRFSWLLKCKKAENEDWPNANLIEFLKHGRMFSIKEDEFIIVGRHQKDNINLKKLLQKDDLLFSGVGYPCPLVVVPKISNEDISEETKNLAKNLAASYGDTAKEKNARVALKINEQSQGEFKVIAQKINSWQEYMIPLEAKK